MDVEDFDKIHNDCTGSYNLNLTASFYRSSVMEVHRVSVQTCFTNDVDKINSSIILLKIKLKTSF